MSDLAKQLLQEARAALENAARNNDALPQWVQEIITPAGWSHYRKLQGQEHSGGVAGFTTPDINHPCQEKPPPEQKKERPTWESITQPRNERGLLIYCSQCQEKAIWYGNDCTPYCDTHWQEQKKLNTK